MDSGYELRWFEKNDLNAFLNTFELVFNVPLSKEYFKWKYAQNPLVEDDPLIVVVEEIDTGAAVGFRGCVPTRLRMSEDVVKAMYFADVMVHPDHRRRGLNSKMIDFALSAFQDTSFRLYYNFPRTLTHLGNIKRGFRKVSPVTDSLLVNNPGKLSGIVFEGWLLSSLAPPAYRLYSFFRGRPRGSDLKVSLTPGTLRDIEDLYYSWSQSEAKIHTVRDTEYLTWRFEKMPLVESEYWMVNLKEKPAGYFIVTRKFDETDSIILNDYLISNNDPAVFRNAILELIDVYSEKSSLITWAFTEPRYQTTLSEMGFLESTKYPLNKFVTQRTFVSRPTMLDVDNETHWAINDKNISHLSSWYLTPSDSDIV